MPKLANAILGLTSAIALLGGRGSDEAALAAAVDHPGFPEAG